jgi:hypothetical protein
VVGMQMRQHDRIDVFEADVLLQDTQSPVAEI